MSEPIKLNLGSGPKKMDGYLNVDRIKFDNVDVVCDLGVDRWPWEDGTIEEIHASHLVEHLKPEQRIHFINEAHRVLEKGKRCIVVVPHHASGRAYGDLTHEWPPVVEFWFAYLNADWRKEQAPHETRYTCDFLCFQPAYFPNERESGRSLEYLQFAFTHYRETADDMSATLIKK